MLFSADDKVILSGFFSGSFLVAFLKGLSLGNEDGTFEDPLWTSLGTACVLLHTQNALQAQSSVSLASLQRLSVLSPAIPGQCDKYPVCTGLPFFTL